MTNPNQPNRSIMVQSRAWMEWLRAGGRSSRTTTAYANAIAKAVKFWKHRHGPALVHQVRLQDLEAFRDWLVKKGLLSVTVGFYLRPLAFFFHWLDRRGEILLNPARGLVIPKERRRLYPVISEQEMARLLESVPMRDPFDLRDRAIFETAYATGMRLGELAALDVTDVDFAEGVVVVTGKGRKQRTLPLTRKAAEVLRRYLETSRPALLGGLRAESALWVTTRTPGRFHAASIRNMVLRRSGAIGLRLTPHSFRRAFATHMLRRGAGAIELQMLLGHADLSHLRHYLRYAIVDLQKTHRKARVSR